jgi:hypothetical protein
MKVLSLFVPFHSRELTRNDLRGDVGKRVRGP